MWLFPICLAKLNIPRSSNDWLPKFTTFGQSRGFLPFRLCIRPSHTYNAPKLYQQRKKKTVLIFHTITLVIFGKSISIGSQCKMCAKIYNQMKNVTKMPSIYKFIHEWECHYAGRQSIFCSNQQQLFCQRLNFHISLPRIESPRTFGKELNNQNFSGIYIDAIQRSVYFVCIWKPIYK